MTVTAQEHDSKGMRTGKSWSYVDLGGEGLPPLPDPPFNYPNFPHRHNGTSTKILDPHLITLFGYTHSKRYRNLDLKTKLTGRQASI